MVWFTVSATQSLLDLVYGPCPTVSTRSGLRSLPHSLYTTWITASATKSLHDLVYGLFHTVFYTIWFTVSATKSLHDLRSLPHSLWLPVSATQSVIYGLCQRSLICGVRYTVFDLQSLPHGLWSTVSALNRNQFQNKSR